MMILELDTPFSGLIHVSGEPMRHALQIIHSAVVCSPRAPPTVTPSREHRTLRVSPGMWRGDR